MRKISLVDVLKLVISLVVCQFAGVIGAIFTLPQIPIWYETLNKPSFTPPNWLFSPVWTFLFLLMGVSAFLIWRMGSKKKGVRTALAIFILQLLLNIMWSVLFFGLESIFGGLAGIAILWLAILLTIIRFCKLSKMAGLLLLPYILWVSFASVLNFSIWRLNI